MSHTPGPWNLEGKYVYAPGSYICEINFPMDDPEVAANTNLITAAPRLKEALEELMSVSAPASGISMEYFCKVYDKAQAAIDQADGR